METAEVEDLVDPATSLRERAATIVEAQRRRDAVHRSSASPHSFFGDAFASLLRGDNAAQQRV